MAVTGVFQADFASFYDAVTKADVQLRAFDSGAAKVESTLSRMTDSFSGRKIIQEATMMAEVFQRAGGSAKFTDAELARMGATGAEAVAKMRALGLEVPANLEKLAGATTKVVAPTQTLSTTYRQFDGVLQAMGVNIGPQVKGLEDIAAASGKTASSMGVLGTAGIAAGAAFAGWQIGRWIADLTGADKAVEKLAQTWLGFASIADQVGGAKMDTINRAIAQGARDTISYTEAIKFNADAVKRNADAKIDWTAKLADAHREVRGLNEAQLAGIATAQQAGASVEQITNKYGISAVGLQLLADKKRQASEAAKAHAAELEKEAVAAAALDKAYAKLNSEVKNEGQLERMKKDKADMDFMEAASKSAHDAELKRISDRTAAEATSEAARIAANQAEIDGLLMVGAASTDAGAASKGATDTAIAGHQQLQQQITITGEGIREWGNLMQYTAKANAILMQPGSGLFTTQSQRERLAGVSMPGLPSSARMGGGGGGQVFNNNFQIVDTESNIARRVSDNIMRTVKSGSQLTQ